MRRYTGETIEGEFVGFDFTDCDLTGVWLVGTFVGCVFNATFYHANRRAEFIDCEVRG